MDYGFINLQRIVEQSIITFITGNSSIVDIDLSMRVSSLRWGGIRKQGGRERERKERKGTGTRGERERK